MRRITRRQLLSVALPVAGMLAMSTRLSPAGEASGPEGIPGLEMGALDQYLRGIPAGRFQAGRVQGVWLDRQWQVSADDGRSAMKVEAAGDWSGRVRRLEASAMGFAVSEFLEFVAAVPYDGSEGQLARGWTRDVLQAGVARWPAESRAAALHGGMRYVSASSFNSNGFRVRLSVYPPDQS